MTQSIEQSLKQWLISNLGLGGDSVTRISLEHPTEMSHGDFATNVALIEAKKRGKNPRDLAAEFVQVLQEKKLDVISKIETAGPGFINIFLKPEYFANTITGIDASFGSTAEVAGQKIMVEFTDPNPFKEFHIGHLMSNAIGESISRVLEMNGADVKRANWQGDVGMHIATALWALIAQPLDMQTATAGDLGKAYAYGSEKAKDDENVKAEIVEINKKIFSREDIAINELYDAGRKISLDYFEGIYAILGTTFTYYFFESIEGPKGKALVEKFLEKGVFEKSDGAIIFPGEKYGLHTRVFINSHGLPTYEAKELGLNQEKFIREPELSKSVIVTGNEIREYFKVLLEAMSLVLPDVAGKTLHIPHGMMRLSSGKMSSRTGNVITAEALITEVKEKLLEKMADRDMTDAEKTAVAQIVAVGALKYSILRQAIGGDIIFDFDKSLSFEGDSGPYVQYAYVRTQSILAKVGTTGQSDKEPKTVRETKMPANWQTTTVEKLLARFPEVIERAGREYAPHHIVTYVTELASAFNAFYAHEKIIDENDPQSAYKIAVTRAVGVVLKNGLQALGIKVPERM